MTHMMPHGLRPLGPSSLQYRLGCNIDSEQYKNGSVLYVVYRSPAPISRMSSTGKAISRAHNDAHDETSEVRTGSHSRRTSTQGQPPLASPNSTSDDSVLVVDWNGPDDPENPRKCGLISVLSLPSSHHFTIRSWRFRQKWGATVIVSAFTLISPISSSMIAPASEQLAERFEIHSTVLLAMTTSVFILAFGAWLSFSSTTHSACSFPAFAYIAFGPLFLGPLSEVYGRSHVLQISNLWYLRTCVAYLSDHTSQWHIFTI
jgi:hypothetical protein